MATRKKTSTSPRTRRAARPAGSSRVSPNGGARTDRGDETEDEEAPESGGPSRPIWRGVIAFGLVNVPVSLHSGERRVDLHFRLLDSRNQTPIRYERVNMETGEEVPWSEVVKAFEYEKGSYVLIEKEAIQEAAPKGTETVEIESFVKREEINPMYYEKPYYLLPGKKAEKGYVLLRDALKDGGKVGVGRVVIRTREYLAILMPLDQALVLNLLRYDQEVVKPSEFRFPAGDHASYHITAREEELASQVVASMSAPWRPAAYRDEFRDRLVKIIKGRMAEGGHVAHRPGREKLPPEATTNVVDFMPLLKKSLESRGGAHAGAAAGGTAARAARSSRSVRPRVPRGKRSA